MKELKPGDRVAAAYLGWAREYPAVYIGTVKNVTENFVTIYPEKGPEWLQSRRWIGRKDKDGRRYFTAPKERVISIDFNICG